MMGISQNKTSPRSHHLMDKHFCGQLQNQLSQDSSQAKFTGSNHLR